MSVVAQAKSAQAVVTAVAAAVVVAAGLILSSGQTARAADYDASADYYRGYRDALRDVAKLDRWRMAPARATSGYRRTWPSRNEQATSLGTSDPARDERLSRYRETRENTRSGSAAALERLGEAPQPAPSQAMRPPRPSETPLLAAPGRQAVAPSPRENDPAEQTR